MGQYGMQGDAGGCRGAVHPARNTIFGQPQPMTGTGIHAQVDHAAMEGAKSFEFLLDGAPDEEVRAAAPVVLDDLALAPLWCAKCNCSVFLF